MTRFSVGVDEAGAKKRKRKHPSEGPSRKSKRIHSSGEEEASDGDTEERQREDDRVAVTIDTDVLDCPICCEPLRPPLFQCHNGHVSCSYCCAKLANKCPVCSDTIGFSRCLALEKVIDSIRIPCCYTEYGCKRVVSYPQRDAHVERCIHAPCSCPQLGCLFRGSTAMLPEHIIREHHHVARTFSYDLPFLVIMKRTEPFCILHAEDDHIFLLINSSDGSLGHAFDIACIQPITQEWEFLYKLTANSEGNKLQMEASTTNIRSILDNHLRKVFLMVPSDFFSSGQICLNVCIQKVKVSAVT